MSLSNNVEVTELGERSVDELGERSVDELGEKLYAAYNAARTSTTDISTRT